VSLLSLVSWLRAGQVDTKLASVSAFSVKPPLRKTTHLEDAKLREMAFHISPFFIFIFLLSKLGRAKRNEGSKRHFAFHNHRV
jgi:hypothetical protein